MTYLFCTTVLDWIEQCFMSPPTQYRLYGRRFLQVKRPNQQYQSTEGTNSTQTNQTYTVSQKKVAHRTLQNIFAQGWRIAKISTATESETISEHKYVINVLIFNVPKCCHLANYRVSNWQLCVQCTKTAHYFEDL